MDGLRYLDEHVLSERSADHPFCISTSRSSTRRDLINANMGGLLFLPQQSARIPAEVLSRVQASRTARDSMLGVGN